MIRKKPHDKEYKMTKFEIHLICIQLQISNAGMESSVCMLDLSENY